MPLFCRQRLIMASNALASLFEDAGGSGRLYESPGEIGMEFLQDNSEFMQNFQTPMTGVNGLGPINNENANLLPTRSDQYHDISNTLDYRLGNGMGVSRFNRKTDSMSGNTAAGFYGFAKPSKMFGRDSKTPDLNYERDNLTARARGSLKKMGFKNAEVPEDSNFFPWQWNDINALGIGSGHNYNRNHTLPDADAVHDRLYKPAPSRLTKQLQTDIETISLVPQRTLLDPEKVVSEDRQREKLQRIRSNADVFESVIYEKIMPRGMGSRSNAPIVYSDTDALRQPVGTNDTGDKSVFDIWKPGFSEINPLLDVSLEDRLASVNYAVRSIEGKNPDSEFKDFIEQQRALDRQNVQDPFAIHPKLGEFPFQKTGSSNPLVKPPTARKRI